MQLMLLIEIVHSSSDGLGCEAKGKITNKRCLDSVNFTGEYKGKKNSECQKRVKG